MADTIEYTGPGKAGQHLPAGTGEPGQQACIANAAPMPFRLADIPAQPWKNGGGLTREIACWPPGAGMDDFLWRISVARIDAGGPFSRFAGVDRVITLLSGPGVALRGGFPGAEHVLTQPLAPFSFAGDVEVDCELEGGASEDFNVMSRRGRVLAQVSVIREDSALPAASSGLLMAVGSKWLAEADDGGEYELEPGAGLWWAQAARAWRLRTVAGHTAVGHTVASHRARDRGLISVVFEIRPSEDDGSGRHTS